jgi:pimeloyl-ACP methyl ester carboxylesterase
MSQAQAVERDPIQHNFADVNGVRLHYASVGSGAGAGRDRKLIVFLHGFPEFWYAWRKQLLEFGREMLAVAPDMRGYNLSSKPEGVERYGISELVGDVCGLVRLLGAKSCCLVGHDWGGVVAWATAIAAPEFVEKLVIINAPHPGIFERELRENPAQQQASQYMLLFRSPEAEAIISANNFGLWQAGIMSGMLREGYLTEADRAAYLEAWSQPGALTGGLNYYRAAKVGPPSGGSSGGMRVPPNMASLEVKAPTLVIWGEKDPYLLTGNLNGLEKYVPRLRIERIPDATHWVVHEKGALVNSLMREFLRV